MRVRRIDHVQLAMPIGGEASAIEFYEGVLGLPHVPKPAHLVARGGCWFEDGDLKVHLGAEENFRPARKAHPALVVEGLDDLIERLASHGFVVRFAETPSGAPQVYVDDPFGNRIELVAEP